MLNILIEFVIEVDADEQRRADPSAAAAFTRGNTQLRGSFVNRLWQVTIVPPQFANLAVVDSSAACRFTNPLPMPGVMGYGC